MCTPRRWCFRSFFRGWLCTYACGPLLLLPLLLLLYSAEPSSVVRSPPPGPASTGTVSNASHSGHGSPHRSRPPPGGNNDGIRRIGEKDGGRAAGVVPTRSPSDQSNPNATTPEGLNAVSPRPLHRQRPSLESRSPTHVAGNAAVGASQAGGGRAAELQPPPGITTAATGGDNTIGSPPKAPVSPVAPAFPSASLPERAGGGEFVRDRENKVRQGSPVPLPKGMTGDLMRQVAALDVTRMSCEQVRLSCRQPSYGCNQRRVYEESSWLSRPRSCATLNSPA